MDAHEEADTWKGTERFPTEHVPTSGDGYGPRMKLWFRRAMRTDLQPIALLPDERVVFEVENLHQGSDPLLRVMAWRRAALFVAALFLAVPTVVHLIKSLIDLGDGADTFTALGLLITLSSAALAVGVWSAHRTWDQLARSRRILFGFWLVAFIVPFAVCLFPVRAGREGAEAVAMGVAGALSAVMLLAPKVLSLVPGLIRAALASKALFPGSPAPGWLITLGAPLYLMLLFLVMQMPYQLAGGGFMALALIALMAAPIVLWFNGRVLARPGPLDETLAHIRKIRMLMLVLNAVGGLFLFIGLIDMVASMQGLSILDTFLPLLSVIANVFVLAVVGLDLTMKGLQRAHRIESDPETQALRESHTQDMDAFIVAIEASQEAASPVRTPE